MTNLFGCFWFCYKPIYIITFDQLFVCCAFCNKIIRIIVFDQPFWTFLVLLQTHTHNHFWPTFLDVLVFVTKSYAWSFLTNHFGHFWFCYKLIRIIIFDQLFGRFWFCYKPIYIIMFDQHLWMFVFFVTKSYAKSFLTNLFGCFCVCYKPIHIIIFDQPF